MAIVEHTIQSATNLGLSAADRAAANEAISPTALDDRLTAVESGKIDTDSISTDIAADTGSDVLVPSVKAVEDAIAAAIAAIP